jgi:hypothetical protein
LGVIKQDTTQYSESYVGHMINTDNLFYPEVALDVYRVIGNEQLKVNAGTFDCNVIEGMRDEVKIKMWMIMDKPGVYAKIIEEGKNVFGDNEYIVTELEALNLKNDRP